MRTQLIIVGVGLPAMAVGQSTLMLTVLASSLASQLPQGMELIGRGENTADYCGSWLASNGGGSVDIDVDCAGLIAGKPAPTGDGVDW
ncbi:hypothetical protein DBR18_13010 [Pseudomonas sp. HMWF021]|nr:hypothetical protein DBR18_13010 [Pseudomonas sp. HMWF021]